MFGTVGSSGSGAVTAKQAMADLHAALDQLRAADLSDADSGDLEALVDDLYRVDARLAGERGAVLRKVQAEKTWQSSGARSAAMWVATRTRVPKGRVGSDLKLARILGTLQATDEALRDGTITRDAARLIAKCG